MTKKYKLIREYPGSHKLGTISWLEGNMTSVKSHNPEDFWYITFPINYTMYPDFWEEIIEKEYEILSFINTRGIIYKKDSQINQYCENNGKVPFFNEKELLNNLVITIHSIKRLSDGEIFTIGDDCVIKGRNEPSDKIKNFSIKDRGLSVYARYYTQYINDIEHFKQPLFTTEDGVDIFEGDLYYFIKKDNNYLLDRMSNRKFTGTPDDDTLTFFSKEKAEEYIVMNKPCLSINEILKISTNNYRIVVFGNRISYLIGDRDLEKLVKSKL